MLRPGFLEKDSISGIKKAVLDNGLKVFLEYLPEKNKVMLMVGIGAGVKDETNENHGINHFLEHIQFHSNRFRDSAQITEDVENQGAKIDAGTEFDFTMVWIRGDPRYFSKNIRIIYEAITNFKYDEDEIEKERNQILSELRKILDTPENYYFDYLFIPALLRKTFSERPILGTTKTIKRLSLNDLVAFKRKFYVPANMAIFVCGSFNEEKVLETIEKTFGRLKPRKFEPLERKFSLKIRRKEDVRSRKNLKQAYMILGYRVNGFNHRDSLKLMLLNSILSNGMSSRIFKKLRSEQGIGYDMGSNYDDYAGIGVFYIEVAGFDSSRFKETKSIILGELEDLKTNLVSKEEFTRAKNLFISDVDDELEILEDKEGQEGRAHLLSGAYFKNYYFDYRNYRKEIAKVSRKALRRCAQKYFGKGYTLTALVPENFTP